MKKTLLFFSMVFCFVSFAQNGKIVFETNYNTFSHTSLSDFQEEFKNDLREIPIKTTDDFPGNFGFSLGYELVDKNVLIFASYNSTGGKLSYSDYSGVVRITEELKGYTFGAEYLIPFSETDNNFTLGLRGFGMFTTMNLENYTQISESVSQDEIEFQSANLGVGARMLYEYPVSFFIIRASVGFDLTFGGSFTFKENSDYHLQDNNEDKVKSNWSGLRTSVGIAIPLNN